MGHVSNCHPLSTFMRRLGDTIRSWNQGAKVCGATSFVVRDGKDNFLYTYPHMQLQSILRGATMGQQPFRGRGCSKQGIYESTSITSYRLCVSDSTLSVRRATNEVYHTQWNSNKRKRRRRSTTWEPTLYINNSSRFRNDTNLKCMFQCTIDQYTKTSLRETTNKAIASYNYRIFRINHVNQSTRSPTMYRVYTFNESTYPIQCSTICQLLQQHKKYLFKGNSRECNTRPYSMQRSLNGEHQCMRPIFTFTGYETIQNSSKQQEQVCPFPCYTGERKNSHIRSKKTSNRERGSASEKSSAYHKEKARRFYSMQQQASQ